MRVLFGEVHSAIEKESEHGCSSPGYTLRWSTYRGFQMSQDQEGKKKHVAYYVMSRQFSMFLQVVFNNWSGDGSELNENKEDSSDLLIGSKCYM